MSSCMEVLFEGHKLEQEYLGDCKPVNLIVPLVSVVVSTYQHTDFIRQCLDGILMQKTDFLFEIIIGEDESTDGTRAVCAEYAQNHPDKIRLFLRNRETSQYFENGKFVCRFNGRWARMSARGKYVALCEGDDYWTDPLKLQKQVDFLEKHTDCSICHHNMVILYEESDKPTQLSNPPDQKEFSTIEDLCKGNFIYTASCMYRNGLVPVLQAEWCLTSPVGDYPLHMHNALYGTIGYLNEPMGVYRIHQGGTWGNKPRCDVLNSWMVVLELFIKNFDSRYRELLKDQATVVCLEVVQNLVRERRYKDALEYMQNWQSITRKDIVDCLVETISSIDSELKTAQQVNLLLRNSYRYKLGALFVDSISLPQELLLKLWRRVSRKLQ